MLNNSLSAILTKALPCAGTARRGRSEMSKYPVSYSVLVTVSRYLRHLSSYIL